MAEISKILSSRQDVAQTLTAMLSALDKQFPDNVAQFSLGKTCTHYSTDIAEMEGLSRALWGLFPLLAGGAEVQKNIPRRFAANGVVHHVGIHLQSLRLGARHQVPHRAMRGGQANVTHTGDEKRADGAKRGERHERSP